MDSCKSYEVKSLAMKVKEWNNDLHSALIVKLNPIKKLTGLYAKLENFYVEV
jgi:hypothetical protein